ncbi:terpene synthase family protein [Actinomadura gamaensis]|uniref:Terpene synthase n=1 Tax=Actinomadura gamaensis TaxID=1763541 RepID=A0ABV9TYF0_9ACTN
MRRSAITSARPAAKDEYLRAGSSTRLWDGTFLSELRTPRHDLTERPRPFPVQRNYFHAAALEESALWLRGVTALEPADCQRLLQEDVGGFVSWVYPDATAGQIRVLSDFHHWAVWLDDIMDRRSTADASLAACAVLESVGSAELAPFDDCLARMRALEMKGRCAERFVHALHRYGTASRVEVQARQGQSRFSSVADYIANRRLSAAMPVYYALIAWISRIDLPDEIFQHPLVVKLENCCSDYSMLYNDAGSFIKEHLAGRSQGTFVRLLSEELDLPVQQTLLEVADMAAAAADDLEAASDLIETCDLPAQQRAQIHHYADGLRKFAGGVNHWSNNTCRYLIGQPVVDTAATSRAGDVHRIR